MSFSDDCFPCVSTGKKGKHAATDVFSPRLGQFPKSDLGPVFATVTFKLDGNVHDLGYCGQDGDAAFLNARTKVYRVKGYSPTFRLAAHENNVA